MDVILHIGAHRCATTSFQNYLRLNAGRLAAANIGFWGPRRTRNGLFRGIAPVPSPVSAKDQARRALGRISMNLNQSEASRVQTLVVSDENIMGSVRENLRLGGLYCGAGERVSRFHRAFGGRVTRLALNVRSPEYFWASSIGYAVARGHRVPGAALLDRLADDMRSWRDVIEDISDAVPGLPIDVLPFETFASRPEAQLTAMTGRASPREHSREWLNATPRLSVLRRELPARQASLLPEGEGRWMPFSPRQAADLRDRYADDLMWLTAGADGRARLVADPDKKQAGQTPPATYLTRGRHDEQNRRLAGAG